MNELFDLSGRVAVVTGSIDSMGFAMARASGQCGARLVVSSGRQQRSDAAAARLLQDEISVKAAPCDATSALSVAGFAIAALECYGQVDSLILNGAGGAPVRSVLEHTPEQVDAVVGVIPLSVRWVASRAVRA